jgi:hypothetical protein
MKNWLIEVGLKTMGPSAVRGAILGIAGWLLAREGALSAFGIISDAAAHTTTIYWDKVSIALIAALPAIGAAVIKMTQHQGTQVIQNVTQPKEETPQ